MVKWIPSWYVFYFIFLMLHIVLVTNLSSGSQWRAWALWGPQLHHGDCWQPATGTMLWQGKEQHEAALSCLHILCRPHFFPWVLSMFLVLLELQKGVWKLTVLPLFPLGWPFSQDWNSFQNWSQLVIIVEAFQFMEALWALKKVALIENGQRYQKENWCWCVHHMDVWVQTSW